jgi:ribosomal protein S18 acetylase RimI-like enzyme
MIASDMGHQGRFGKYGETKRLGRLRQAGTRTSSHQESRATQAKQRPSPGGVGRKGGRVRIREALASDADFVGRLSGRVFRVYGPYRETVSQWFHSGQAITLIAHRGGNPVGFAMFSHGSPDSIPRRHSELLAIAVLPEEHRTGIGQRLLGEAERSAAEHHVTRLFLHTAGENLSAVGLFEKSGYHPVELKTHFYPAGQDALLMFKDLPPARDGRHA